MGLACGDDSLDLIDYLIKGQLAKHLLRLGKAAGLLDAASAVRRMARGVDRQYVLLADLQRNHPQAVNSLLLDPDVAIWLANARGEVPIGLIAAAAAVKTGTPVEVSVPLTNGAVFLPTLGTAVFARQGDLGTATLVVGSDGVQLSADGATIGFPADLATVTDTWKPVRWLELGTQVKLRVMLGDSGPLWAASSPVRRQATQIPIGGGEQAWYRSLADAWRILETHHLSSAIAIAAGLRTIIPDAVTEGWNNNSATLNGIFGVTVLGLPAPPLMIACNLVHEFQHAKLAALQDLITLVDPGCDHLYYAPWRYDPRPLPALLQGVYAHLGVAQFWDAQRRLSNHDSFLLAQVEFARWSEDTWQACNSIASDDHFTAEGAIFIDRVQARLAELRAESLPPAAVSVARRVGLDHELSWRVGNFELDREVARDLAMTWLSGASAPAVRAGRTARRKGSAVRGQRISLIYRKLFHDLRDMQQPSASPADWAYAEGDLGAALAAYGSRITDDPQDLDAWVGTVLCLSEAEAHLCRALVEVSDIAPAVFRQATEAWTGRLDPAQLLRWLTNVA